ncbi:hypothetical protein GCM10008966_30720 [Rhodovulum strictum]
MAAIAQRRGLDRVQDLGGGTYGARGDSRSNPAWRALIGMRVWSCKEKEAIRLRLGRTVKRAQEAPVLADRNQPAIRANRENEPVSQGRRRGTDACTQGNDERDRAVSCP